MVAQAWGKVCRIPLQCAYMSQDMCQSLLINSKAHHLLDLQEQDVCKTCSWWYLYCADSQPSNTYSHPMWAWAFVKAMANSQSGMVLLSCHCCNPSIMAFVIAWSVCWSCNKTVEVLLRLLTTLWSLLNTELCVSYTVVAPDIMSKQCWFRTATVPFFLWLNCPLEYFVA